MILSIRSSGAAAAAQVPAAGVATMGQRVGAAIGARGSTRSTRRRRIANPIMHTNDLLATPQLDLPLPCKHHQSEPKMSSPTKWIPSLRSLDPFAGTQLQRCSALLP